MTDDYAAGLERAGLLRSEYPDEMAKASCTCEPEAVCGAHRLLTRYEQMYEHMLEAHKELKVLRSQVREMRDSKAGS